MQNKVLLWAMLILAIFTSCNKNLVDSKSIQQVSFDIKNTETSVTLSKATSLAIKFLQNRFHNQNYSVKHATTLTIGNTPYFHIINANKGFVIMSVDSICLPILAYDSLSNFSLEKKDVNTGIALWLNKQASQLDFIRTVRNTYTDSIAKQNKLAWITFDDIYQNNFTTNTNTRNAKNATRTKTPSGQNESAPVDGSNNPNCITFYGDDGYWNNIGPLCGVYWYQGAPYNQYCPTGTGGVATDGHVPTGCNATAIAQVMRYWNFPASYNLASQAPWVDKTNPQNDPVYHPERFNLAASLMHDIGITPIPPFYSTFTSYSPDGSTAYLSDAPFVFSNFGYSGTGNLAGYTSQSTPVFSGHGTNTNTGLIINEIATNQRPCLLDGWPDETNLFLGAYYTASGIGHTWVCDGLNGYYSKPYYQKDCYYPDGTLVTTKAYAGAYIVYGYLHMNWGFSQNLAGGPKGDGWYDYTTDYMVAGNGANYKYFQQVLYNIHP